MSSESVDIVMEFVKIVHAHVDYFNFRRSICCANRILIGKIIKYSEQSPNKEVCKTLIAYSLWLKSGKAPKKIY